MTFLQAFILGVVEGFTEYLPISSTGHLMITARLLGIASSDFLKSFQIAIQLGAILSVVVLYFRRFFLDGQMVKRIMTAFIPTMVVGFVFYDLIRTVFLESITVVAWSLLAGGAVIIFFELWYWRRADRSEKPITSGRAWGIGLAQSVAVIPGVSRSAASILGGAALGVSRRQAVEFSFLLAVPTMLAATGLDILNFGLAWESREISLLAIGFASSFIAGLIGVKFFLGFIRGHSFLMFGFYRVILAIFLLAL